MIKSGILTALKVPYKNQYGYQWVIPESVLEGYIDQHTKYASRRQRLWMSKHKLLRSSPENTPTNIEPIRPKKRTQS